MNNLWLIEFEEYYSYVDDILVGECWENEVNFEISQGVSKNGIHLGS